MLALQDMLSLGSGGLVGLILGLIGGGGSILAVPLLVYVVGISSAHVAIGTSAIAVAASAAINLAGHARAGTVRWPCAIVFAVSGMAGATMGAQFGKMVDGQRLLALFGALMIVIGLSMLRPRRSSDDTRVRLNRSSAARLLPMLIGGGLLVGVLSGFFGIGGGFLVVPGLIGATAMPLIDAIGSSLVSVTAFGSTTAASYAASGLVDWRIAALFVVGGAAGGVVGTALAKRLARQKRALSLTFSGVVTLVGLYILAKSIIA
jgi:uncharacterized membrane protein YfcA